MKLIFMPFLLCATTLLTLSSTAQQRELKNIHDPLLMQLVKERKPIHFVIEQTAGGPVIQFSQQQQTPHNGSQNGVSNDVSEIAAGGNFHLTKDINAQTDANVSNNNTLYKDSLAILNNVLYFSTDDGIHGSELWRSNGTAAGTYMVKDIEPGSVSSAPSEIITVKNKLYFVTQNNITFSNKLWISDGTDAGTIELQDLGSSGPGIDGSRYLTNVSGTVYFLNGSPYNTQVWKTDGTTAGTIFIKDLTAFGNTPILSATANGLYYFTFFSNTNGRELWRSDGTDAGTFMVKDISDTTDFFYGPNQLTPFNNKLYFSADDGTGRKLWFTDGTTAGTQKVTGSNNLTLLFNYLFEFVNVPFAIQKGDLFFGAAKPATGTELYKYSNNNGFSLVKDITPGTRGGAIYNVTKTGNYVAFVYQDTVKKENQLWATTGTSDSTVLIKSYADYVSFFSSLIYNAGLLYFTSYTPAYGNELWKTSGTSNSTVIVKDIYAGITSSNPLYLTPFKSELYFAADAKKSGIELWSTDGSNANTNMVTEINSTATNYSGPNYYGNNAGGGIAGSAIGNTLFFTATKPETGFELYKSDGSNAGTVLAKDIDPGESSSFPDMFTTKKNFVYFIANTFDSNNIYTNNIFKTDSNGNVTKIASVQESSINSYSVADNGYVFYIVNNYPAVQLWRTDGTLAGNIKLSDSVATTVYPFTVVTVNNKAFFSATDVNHGVELWVSDGTLAGTKLVKDILQGNSSSNPYSLYAYNNDVYFGAFNGSGNSLWKSNGTASGTIELKAISPYSGYDYINYFCVANGILYLNAVTSAQGAELWKTNGTKPGTRLVKDIETGTNSSNPAYFTNVNGSLYFLADNQQLWKSDGSTAGTVLIKDLSSSSYYAFSERCVADGKFFFNKDQLLWVSDGTDKGTQQVNDAGLNNVSLVTNLAVANNTLFFNGYTNKYSYELYAGDASKVTTVNGLNKTVSKKQNTFTATVVQNPVQSTLNLSIKSNKNQTLNIIVSNVHGNAVAMQKINVVEGINTVKINAQNWFNSLYVVNISGDEGDEVSMQILK